MKTARLRALIRKYGEFGVLLVACYLLLHHLWHRRRGLLALLVAGLCLAYSWWKQPVYLVNIHHPSQLSAPTAAYKLTDLGALPGGDYSIPYGINSKGQVVGYSLDSRDQLRAFLWQNGKMADLGTLGGPGSLAAGINAQGQVVGTSLTQARQVHGFVYRNGKLQDLGTLGGEYSDALGINDKGHAVGGSETKDDNFHAFLWQDGKMRNIGAAQGSFFNLAVGINNRDEVAGEAFYSRTFNAFLYRDGKFQKIPTLGGDNNFAAALNNGGQVAGSSDVKPHSWDPMHAFVWQDGKARDLGTLGGSDSGAAALNDAGQVVGWALTGLQVEHAFLWQNGKMIDLNALISRRDWRLIIATGINADGQIIGVGASGGKYHGFLLTPSR